MKGFEMPPDLPPGVEELFLLTKYHVGHAAPKYERGARLRGTGGGFKIFAEDGTAQTSIIPHYWTLEQWRDLLGRLLDSDLRWKENRTAELFRDPFSIRK